MCCAVPCHGPSPNHTAGKELRAKGLNRIGNMLVPNSNYCLFEDWIMPLLDQMLAEQKEQGTVWTPSKVCDGVCVEGGEQRAHRQQQHSNTTASYVQTSGSVACRWMAARQSLYVEISHLLTADAERLCVVLLCVHADHCAVRSSHQPPRQRLLLGLEKQHPRLLPSHHRRQHRCARASRLAGCSVNMSSEAKCQTVTPRGAKQDLTQTWPCATAWC